MDWTHPDIDDTQFPVLNWKESYGIIKEPTPPNFPKPLDKPADIDMFVGSDP